jgi:alkanesulfonate monooxygenase SsuD/methylene tetrahydromethanopterin reductase-like flavin-dependent oxidoreductase (luciferase family)
VIRVVKPRFGIGLFTFPLDNSRGTEYTSYLHKYLDALPEEYESAWIPDHLIPSIEPLSRDYLECLTTTSYLLPQYPNLKFGQIVLCNNFRNPALLAKMSSTLQVLSGGRFILGIGAGWKQEEYKQYGYEYPSPRARIKQLEEAVQIIKMMWEEDGVTFHGKHYRVENVYCNPKPVPVPPIMIGGTGEKYTLGVVARYADWWNIDTHTSLDEFIHKLSVLEGHCDRVGRDSGDILKTQLQIITIAESDEEAEKVVESNGLKRYVRIAGSPETVTHRLNEFKDAGIEYFIIILLPFRNPELTKIFAENVIPNI